MSFYFIKKFDELNFQDNEYKFKILATIFLENDIIFPQEQFAVYFNNLIIYVNNNTLFLENNCLMFIKALKYIKKVLKIES